MFVRTIQCCVFFGVSFGTYCFDIYRWERLKVKWAVLEFLFALVSSNFSIKWLFEVDPGNLLQSENSHSSFGKGVLCLIRTHLACSWNFAKTFCKLLKLKSVKLKFRTEDFWKQRTTKIMCTNLAKTFSLSTHFWTIWPNILLFLWEESKIFSIFLKMFFKDLTTVLSTNCFFW